MIDDLNSGKLRRECNETTMAHGHGRLRDSRGQFVDIGGSTAGATRKALDNYIEKDWRNMDWD